MVCPVLSSSPSSPYSPARTESATRCKPEIDPLGVRWFPDVVMKSAVSTWTCDNDKINVGGKCEQTAVDSYNCVNDLLFMVPRHRFGAFDAAIGSSTGNHGWYYKQCGCFDPSCHMPAGMKHPKSGGHDCFAAFAYQLGDRTITNVTKRIEGGAQLVGNCWPPVTLSPIFTSLPSLCVVMHGWRLTIGWRLVRCLIGATQDS